MTPDGMLMSYRRFGALAVVVLSLGSEACGGEEESRVSGAEIRIVGTEMAFSPSEATATVGRHPVSFVNEGATYHELAIVAPDGTVLGARSIPGGETAAFEVDLGEPGAYRMVCREPGHTEAGMVGTLTVTGVSSR